MTDHETTSTTSTTPTTPPPVSWWRFLLGEVRMAVAPAATILQEHGGSAAQLLPATSATSSMAVSSSSNAFDANLFVRLRRVSAVWYSLCGVVLPALPLVSGVVDLVLGVERAVAAVIIGAVVLVPFSIVGTLCAGRLAPQVLRAFGAPPS